MKVKTGIILLSLALSAVAGARAQSLIVSVPLGPNQIGQVKTAQGITTRISFPEPVRDIVCGDLYDSATGKGSFVLQRIDNDVFLKPVVSKGLSNLFVKTGEKGDKTYSFDLHVVPLEQAHRVINVTDVPATRSAEAQSQAGAPESGNKILESAQQKADDLVRTARQQADRIMAQANIQASDVYTKALQRGEQLDKVASERAQKEVEERFVRAMIQGVKEVRSTDAHVGAKKVTLVLDPRVLTFDDKSYLRYTLKNTGDREFSFRGLSLERRGTSKEAFVIPARVIQGRLENKLKPGETIVGIIVFEAKEVSAEDRLTLYVRGKDNAEIARLNIQ
jgi:vacuolar-type H+-ATPase subunit H